MGKAKPGFYGVRAGHCPGVYTEWKDVQVQISGYSGALQKKFTTETEAWAYVNVNGGGGGASSGGGGGSGMVATSLGVRRLDNGIGRSLATRDKSPYFRPLSSTTPAAPPAASSSRTTLGALKDTIPTIIAYTDGACKGTGRRTSARRPRGAGFGGMLRELASLGGKGLYHRTYLSEHQGSHKPTTEPNFTQAILRALELDPDPTAKFKIYTDSQYCIKCFTEWLPGWQRRALPDGSWIGSSGKQVANQDLIKAIIELRRLREAYCRNGVEMIHIKGHSGDQGNEAADRLAVEGVWRAKEAERDFSAIQRVGGYHGFVSWSEAVMRQFQRAPALGKICLPLWLAPQNWTRKYCKK